MIEITSSEIDSIYKETRAYQDASSIVEYEVGVVIESLTTQLLKKARNPEFVPSPLSCHFICRPPVNYEFRCLFGVSLDVVDEGVLSEQTPTEFIEPSKRCTDLTDFGIGIFEKLRQLGFATDFCWQFVIGQTPNLHFQVVCHVNTNVNVP